GSGWRASATRLGDVPCSRAAPSFLAMVAITLTFLLPSRGSVRLQRLRSDCRCDRQHGRAALAVELGRRVRPCGPVERRRSLDQQREGRPATDSVLASVPPAAAGHATGVLSDNVTLRSIPLRL